MGVGGSKVIGDGFVMSDKEKKECKLLVTSPARKSFDKLSFGVPINRSEIVVHVRVNKKHANKVFNNDVSLANPNQISREARVAAITDGTFHLVNRYSVLSPPVCFTCCPVTMGYETEAVYPNHNLNLRCFRTVTLDDRIGTIRITYLESPNVTEGQKDSYETFAPTKEVEPKHHVIIFQTTNPSELLKSIVAAVVGTYAGVPKWAIPLKWSLSQSENFVFPSESYQRALGTDSGFSTSFFSASAARIISAKELNHKMMKQGRELVSNLVQFQQRKAKLPTLDIMELTSQIVVKNNKILWCHLVVDALECLPFNLTYRSIFIRDFEPAALKGQFHTSLARVFLYNVTMREMDLSGTNLNGAGVEIGKALSQNAQPLISRVNFSRCKLSDDDFMGLLPGFVRLWCGGTAVPESLDFTDNMDISAMSWESFFSMMVNPGRSRFWIAINSQNPSTANLPPTPLQYLQSLNLIGTDASRSTNLSEFISKLSGLRSFSIEDKGGLGLTSIFNCLEKLSGPTLHHFHGKRIQMSSAVATALRAHSSTLKSITLDTFQGDIIPLFSMWPKEMSKLCITFQNTLRGAFALPPNQHAPDTRFGPGSIIICNNSDDSDTLCRLLLPGIRSNDSLKHITMSSTFHGDLVNLAPFFVSGELQTLTLPSFLAKSTYVRGSEKFFEIISASRSLQEIHIPGQLFSNTTGHDGLVVLGAFLKKNRSVRKLSFDGKSLILTLNGVKALRSAFYGNKKVIEMEYPKLAEQATFQGLKDETGRCIQEVYSCKNTIKQIFKRHYSKYNRNWRETPNRLKLPYVERIRVAKRRIGAIEREMNTIGRLLGEIQSCIQSNRTSHEIKLEDKVSEKLERRGEHLQKLASKKKKLMTKIASQVHKSKARGRQGKAAKDHVPRSAYYKDRNIWPGANSNNTKRSAFSSHTRGLNDPYGMRNAFLFNTFHHHHYNNYNNRNYWNEDDDDELDDIIVIEDPTEGGEENVDESRDVVEEGGEGELPSYVIDNDLEEGDLLLDENQEVISSDAWAGMDELVTDMGGDNLGDACTPEFLDLIHAEAAELGPDVVEAIAPTIDSMHALNDQILNVGDSIGVEGDVVSSIIDSNVAQDFNLEDIQNDFPDLPEIEDADDAVEMYAGAGPRDLDDGGPAFGENGSFALAGARRKARARKRNRIARRIRNSIANHPGYKKFLLPVNKFSRSLSTSEIEMQQWPENLVDTWKEKVTFSQIDVMSKSNIFPIPACAFGNQPELIMEWAAPSKDESIVVPPIEVCLVTQCSLDRLPNLREQLLQWKGLASVTVYLNYHVNIYEAKASIKSCVEGAIKHGSVAVSIVHEIDESADYPINFLRNISLLEANRQQLKRRGSILKTAAFLVDVDFRPSQNLHKVLHCKSSASTILNERKVVVCSAFECDAECVPFTMCELRTCVKEGHAEGFHTSNFPAGHGPTRFDEFFSNLTSSDGAWSNIYKVSYEKYFEPYVIMALEDVPLYDERFQGYGLNKVAHLASVANLTEKCSLRSFYVLPGVFIVAPAHKRSKSWSQIYGARTEETAFQKLWLKSLFLDFNRRLKEGKKPVVSTITQSKQVELLSQIKAFADELKENSNSEVQVKSEKRLKELKAISASLPPSFESLSISYLELFLKDLGQALLRESKVGHGRFEKNNMQIQHHGKNLKSVIYPDELSLVIDKLRKELLTESQ